MKREMCYLKKSDVFSLKVTMRESTTFVVYSGFEFQLLSTAPNHC